MSFQLNIPPSMVTKMVKETNEDGEDEEDGEQGKKTREDYKKLKELEEMRKAGTAPALKDEEGKDINPHIPQYIMQAPWYYGVTQATLSHQRIQEEAVKDFDKMSEWYKKGVKEGPVSTKFRKGACENCGAMTHIKKDCLERPRRLAAKFSGSNFAPDEYVNTKLDFDYDGKRDRWNGYDTNEHSKVIEEFQKIDEAKKVLKAAKFDENTEEEEKEDDSDKDEDKYADDVDMPGQKFETKQRITVRNLRIREDTAKYLYNLNVNSAHYDPKTRSMRENPFEGPTATENKTHMPYIGDNFVRYSGDAMNMAKQQLFAWEAYEKGSEVHLQADPTKLELLNKEFKKRKEDFSSTVKGSILDRYGGQEHLEAPPKQLLMAQSDNYVEYSRHGTVIKGEEKAAVKSQYEEDVYINNHTAVWGSYWKEGQWGFKCCHSCIRESYCTGEAGKDAHDTQMPAIEAAPVPGTSAPAASTSATSPAALTSTAAATHSKAESDEEDSDAEEKQMSLVEQHKAKLKAEKKRKKKEKKKKKKDKKKKKKKKRRKSSSSESDSDSSEDEDEERERKIKEAMEAETMRLAKVERIMALDERKRPYNSMYNEVAPTDEDMEAFRRKRLREEDPMAKFLD